MIQATGHKLKIILKIGLENEWVNTVDDLVTVTKKMYIICRKFCVFFVLFMLNQEKNQAALEKNLIATESAAFSFSVNLDFNNTFSL